ncbi:MAG: hypothetical protein KatS3mg060_1000 [Dehalococcoidia bacterium]|nr:MAG: hypothetical protein KatS3mg060_1000 [Dehalococcoidia bacterium]
MTGSGNWGWGRLLGVHDPVTPFNAYNPAMASAPCPVCGRFANRPVTADAAVVHAGRVLLVQRKHDPFRGAYALPGGFVDPNESPEECALRELREECGLTGTIEHLVGVYAAADRDPQRHTITFVYRIRPDQRPTATPGDDAAAVIWAPLEALPPLAFDHAAILADVRAGVRLVSISG